MKHKAIKWTISLFVIVVLLFSSVSIGFVFASTSTNMIYSDEILVELDGTTEEVISVPIMIKNNTGIAGFELSFTYDSDVLTPIAIISGDDSILTEGMLDSSIENPKNDSFKVIWSGISNLTGNGNLFYISFSVDVNATGSTEVSVNYNKRNTFDENIEEVEFNCENVVINFKNDLIDIIPKVTLSSSDVTAGDTFVVNGIISDVDGLTDATIKIGYDSANITYKSISGNSKVTIFNCKTEIG